MMPTPNVLQTPLQFVTHARVAAGRRPISCSRSDWDLSARVGGVDPMEWKPVLLSREGVQCRMPGTQQVSAPTEVLQQSVLCVTGCRVLITDITVFAWWTSYSKTRFKSWRSYRRELAGSFFWTWSIFYEYSCICNDYEADCRSLVTCLYLSLCRLALGCWVRYGASWPTATRRDR